MNFLVSTVLAVAIFTIITEQQEYDTSLITGYHFHTYFFQNNIDSRSEAQTLREKIYELTDSILAGCRLNRLNLGPVGPHIIGSYETCCNATALSRAQSFFIKNHGNLSVLLHPLTRYERLDHTTRAMWLGKDMPLDISALPVNPANEPDRCLPLEGIIP